MIYYLLLSQTHKTVVVSRVTDHSKLKKRILVLKESKATKNESIIEKIMEYL